MFLHIYADLQITMKIKLLYENLDAFYLEFQKQKLYTSQYDIWFRIKMILKFNNQSQKIVSW